MANEKNFVVKKGITVGAGGNSPYSLSENDGSNYHALITDGDGNVSFGNTIIPLTVDTAAGTAAKTATLSGYTLVPGQLFAVTFTNGNSVSSPTLNLNSSGAVNLRVGSTNASTTTMTLGAGATVLLYYTGSHYQLMGSQRTSDSNTTYTEITEAEIDAGTASTLRTITGRRAQYIIDKAISDASTVYAPISHSHTLGDVTDVDIAGVSDGDILVWDTDKFVANTQITNSSTTDLVGYLFGDGSIIDADVEITTPKVNFIDDEENIISAGMLDTAIPTLSFEGSVGQLFSISDDMSGTIFAVNDISGIPSIEVNADGTVSIAEFSGNVGVGTSSPEAKLDVNGAIRTNDGVYSPESLILGADDLPVIYVKESGEVGIGVDTPTNTLDVDGTFRARTISNSTGDFATVSATGVLQKRTAVQALGDIGAAADSDVVKLTGNQTIAGNKTFTGSSTSFSASAGSTSFHSSTLIIADGVQLVPGKNLRFQHDNFIDVTNLKLNASNELVVNSNIVWHEGNDGAGSGLDADLLDGLNSTAFALASHTHSNITITAGNGLTGGGDLSTSRTLTMGTPSTLTGSTTNSVTSTSHTHAITLSLTDLSNVNTAGQTNGDVLTFNGTNWVPGTSSGSSENVTETITQSSHGFSVGSLVRHNGSSYVTANATTVANAEVLGIVSAVPDANNFTLLYRGRINGLSGLTAGTVYFLADGGGLSSTSGTIDKPLLVATSATSAVFLNYRGAENEDGEVDLSLTQLNDVEITSATEDDVLMYDGDEWINSPILASKISDSTTVGRSLLTLANPGAIRFIRINANNTVTARTAAEFRSDIGAGTSSTTGTVTSVAAGNGLDFTTITASGSVTLGTPGTLTTSSTNSVTATSHTHAVTFPVTGAGNGVTLSSGNIVLGTPGTLTTSTTNGVTASSHTHAVTFPVTGAGNGVTLSGTNIVLGTPTTLTGATTNNVTASSHTHAVTLALTDLTNVNTSGQTVGDALVFDGSNWVPDTVSASGGATGGGGDEVFWENDILVTTNYTITSGKNAMTAGPIEIDDGVTVTVPDGSVWTVV